MDGSSTAAMPAGHDPGWGRFVRLLAGTGLALFLLLLGGLLAIDPYDTGRTGLLRARGVHEQYPFTANVSRARDPRFDAAVFGNSHVQLLRPERLDRLTGLSFVSLMMPATWPADELDVLRWFLANRPSPPRAIVVGLDPFWCLPEIANSQRFPTWLYADRFSTYLAGLVRYRAFEVAAARIGHLRSRKNGIRPDGYWDYGPIYDKLGLANPDASREKLATPKPLPVNETGRFPALDRLRTALARLPPETVAILVRTPVYRTGLPAPGTPEARTEAACRAAIAAVAAGRPRARFVDLYGAGPVADDAASFYDHDHYRDPLAVRIEAEIAAAISRPDGTSRPAGWTSRAD